MNQVWFMINLFHHLSACLNVVLIVVFGNKNQMHKTKMKYVLVCCFLEILFFTLFFSQRSGFFLQYDKKTLQSSKFVSNCKIAVKIIQCAPVWSHFGSKYMPGRKCVQVLNSVLSSLSLQAETFDGTGQPILAIKGARLSDFGGRSLSTQFSSTVMINPEIPEAYKLRGW